MSRLYQREQFTVTSDARDGAGRRVDFVATRSKETYLVEAKWITRRVNVGNIDSLLMRLHSAGPSVIGVLFSMSGFTTTAIKQVKANAHRPILLFDQHDVESIVRRPGQLSEMLQSKRGALVLQRPAHLRNPALGVGRTDEERTQRRWLCRDSVLRDSLIAGTALVVGAALGFGGTVLSAGNQGSSAQINEAYRACSTYATALAISADEAHRDVARMMRTGGWTKREADRITTQVEEGLVPIAMDLNELELSVNSETAVKDAIRGLNDYRDLITDLEADQADFDAAAVDDDVDQVTRDATRFTADCRS